jgi:uncharacterized protein YciI
MKTTVLSAVFAGAIGLCFTGSGCMPEAIDDPVQADEAAATNGAADATAASNEAEYDSLLAQELGADDYGMRRYVMAFLKRGPNRSQDSVEAAAMQRAHMDNINRMAEEGQLLLAGPFFDDGPLRGIYVFDVETVEEARALTETDPAIEAGRLEMELHPWYGPAALMRVKEISERVTRQSP